MIPLRSVLFNTLFYANLIVQMIETSEKGFAEVPGQRFFPALIWTPESEIMM